MNILGNNLNSNEIALRESFIAISDITWLSNPDRIMLILN